MKETNVDLMNNGKVSGEFAQKIMSGVSVDKMRPFIANDGKTYVTVHMGGSKTDPKNYKAVLTVNDGTLQRDEWKHLDSSVMDIAQTRLVGIADLISKGLVYNLGNAMGTTVLETHDVSDAMSAELTMDGVARSKGDRPVYSTNYLPIPIIHSDYEINARVLEASRRMGNPLDTTGAERAARKVAARLESMLFTDTEYAFGGGTIYSYLSHPDINTCTLGTAWDASGVTGATIVGQVREMKQASIDAKHYGPFMLYIPTSYETVMDDDYSTAKGSNTIRERIMQIEGIQGVKVVDTLTDDNVVLVQMTSDTVRLVRGMDITNVQWQTEGQFINKYKVMTIQVPQIRSDYNGACGVTVLS